MDSSAKQKLMDIIQNLLAKTGLPAGNPLALLITQKIRAMNDADLQKLAQLIVAFAEDLKRVYPNGKN